MKHQRQQAQRLRLVGHQLDQRAADGDRLARQPSRLRVGKIIPAAAIGGVDRLEHGVQTRRQLLGFGHLERDAGIPDLGLGARQPPAHGVRAHQEGGRDPDRVETEHGLQHQRRVHGRIDRRMRADEQQFQPLVGKFGCRHQWPPASSAARMRSGSACWRIVARRAMSIERRRATVSSQASGLSGTPSRGQLVSAA